VFRCASSQQRPLSHSLECGKYWGIVGIIGNVAKDLLGGGTIGSKGSFVALLILESHGCADAEWEPGVGGIVLNYVPTEKTMLFEMALAKGHVTANVVIQVEGGIVLLGIVDADRECHVVVEVVVAGEFCCKVVAMWRDLYEKLGKSLDILSYHVGASFNL
jgi:hypothetical protein